jgi:adenylate cyclase
LEFVFCRFDDLTHRYGVEKIKTTGDGCMVAGGLPEARTGNVVAVAEMAFAMLDTVGAIRRATGEPLQLRIGLHTGALVAGVIGSQKVAYNAWDDTVNTAKRIETYGLPGRVHVSAATCQALGDAFRFEPRRLLGVKGKGLIETYFLNRQ